VLRVVPRVDPRAPGLHRPRGVVVSVLRERMTGRPEMVPDSWGGTPAVRARHQRDRGRGKRGEHTRPPITQVQGVGWADGMDHHDTESPHGSGRDENG
jgi:hypothetical protein